MTQVVPRPAAFDRFHGDLDAGLKRVVGDGKSALYAMLRYQLGWTDQMGMPDPHAAPDRVLGTMCLLCAEAVGGDPAQALPAAVGVELAHAFGEIHRAIREGTPGSADRPKLWWVWGHAQGINAGDGMYALARLAVMDLEEKNVEAATVVQAAACLDRACLEMCELQHGDIEHESISPRTPESCVEGLKGRATLYGCATEMGALIGGASAPTAAALSEFGRETGVAAGARRELDLVLSATPEARSDLIEALDKRRTLPIVYALSVATDEARTKLEAAATRQSALDDDHLDELTGILEELGARDYAVRVAGQHAASAMAALARADLDEPVAQQLQQLASYLIGPGR